MGVSTRRGEDGNETPMWRVYHQRRIYGTNVERDKQEEAATRPNQTLGGNMGLGGTYEARKPCISSMTF